MTWTSHPLENGITDSTLGARLSRTLAVVSGLRTTAELEAGLQKLLSEQPQLPVRVGPGLALTWEGPPSGVDAEAFASFMKAVGHLAETVGDLERHARVFRLAREFARRSETDALQAYALECCELFRLRGMAGLKLRQGALHRVSAWDAGTPDVPVFTPADLDVVRSGHPAFRPTGVLLPIAGRFRARAAFWLDVPGRNWSVSDRELLRQIGFLIGLEYERQQALRHLDTLQSLHRYLLGVHPEQSYQTLLERALATIPGAECGSLLVREGELFHYRAAVSFDETEISEVTFAVRDTRDKWYGLGEDAWGEGVPRVQANLLLAAQGTDYVYRGTTVNEPLPSVAAIQSSIGVPILYQGEVYAFLNIDSLTDPDAFSEDSVDLARSFGVQAALLLHEAHLHAQVQIAARTDSLTGLLNRRAFTESLAREIALSHRQRQPLALLVADVREFKVVNDLHGHAAGDQALVEVSRVLQGTLRASDVVFRPAPAMLGGSPSLPAESGEVFRWGGDEFAILLPATDLAGARVVRDRLIQAVRSLRVAGRAIELNIGVAALRADDASGERLLHDADAEMYVVKHAQRQTNP